MNPDTLVVVHAYAGDAHQVENALPVYLHHGCPVLILSPEDAPVTIDHPQVTCRSAGRRAYTGQLTLDRQKAHLEIIAEFPQRYLLLHDSDSVCLSPRIPDYLYNESEDTVFYNASTTTRFIPSSTDDAIEQFITQHLFPEVFQPPLFFTQDSLRKMLDVADDAMEQLPPWAKLIDWWFVVMAREAGLQARAIPDAISRPIWATYEIARVYAMVRLRGVLMLHSIKTKEVLDLMITAHAEHNRDPDGRMLCESW